MAISGCSLNLHDMSLPLKGERSIFSFKDNGVLRFMKKLDFNPSCIHGYCVLPPLEGLVETHAHAQAYSPSPSHTHTPAHPHTHTHTHTHTHKHTHIHAHTHTHTHALTPSQVQTVGRCSTWWPISLVSCWCSETPLCCGRPHWSTALCSWPPGCSGQL